MVTRRTDWFLFVIAVEACVIASGQPVRGQATDSVGDCDPPNVQVRGKVSMRNKTGEAANDFHFYMYQNDRPSVVVTGAQVSAAGCTGASVALDTDDGSGSPPPGNHGAHVDVDGCSIPAGEAITVEVVLCMNERNCVKIKDAEFTKDGDPLPHPKPPPKGGWRVGRPFRGGGGGNRAPGGGGQGAQQGYGGSGNWIHIVCIENDDTRWVVLDELKLLASTTYYADIEDIDWAAIDPIVDDNGEPPVCIPAGGKYCYPFETTGSYLGAHVYLKYKVRVADPGECEPIIADGAFTDAADGANADNGDNGDNDDTVDMFGDHPVEALLTEVLEGADFYTTVQPTIFSFGESVPAVPADFFNPGSEPFFGTVYFSGLPVNPSAGEADTIVRRLEEAYLPDEGSVATVPIQLEAMSLVSTQPIQVVTPSSTWPNLFDVLPGFEQTNNFSAPPTRTAVIDQDGSPLETIHTALVEAFPAGMSLRGQASDSGGPPGLFGIDSFFDIFYQPSPPVPTLPPDSFIRVLIDIQLPDGTHAPMMPPVVTFSDSFFDVFTEVHIPGTGGERIVQHHMHGQISPDRPLRFMQVGLGPEQPGLSLIDLQIALAAGGPVDPLPPLLRISTQSMLLIPGFDSFFDVFCTLEPEFMAVGAMEITRESSEGGTFTSVLQVLPRFAFVPVGGAGPELVLPGVTPIVVQQTAPHAWGFRPPISPVPGSGPNFFPSVESPLAWSAPDGSPHTVNAALGPPCPVPFDFDGDLDVDLADTLVFAACGTGPSLMYAPDSLPPGCSLIPGDTGVIAADFDGDLDVDSADFAAFQRCVSGEGNPADPHCACR